MDHFSDEQIMTMCSFDKAIPIMADVLQSPGKYACLRKGIMNFGDGDVLGTMAAAEKDGPFGVIKSVYLVRQPGQNLPSHQGQVLLINRNAQGVVACFSAHTLTSLRTAAGSAAATQMLSLENAEHHLIIGCGFQAYLHALAVSKIRPIRKLTLVNRTFSKLERLKEKLQELNVEIQLLSLEDFQQNPVKADIISVTTSSTEPVLGVEHVFPGTHINSIGACTREHQELSPALIAEAGVFVDNPKVAEYDAGNILKARDAGFTFDVLQFDYENPIPLRTSDITVYNVTGAASQDLALCMYMYQNAQKLVRNAG